MKWINLFLFGCIIYNPQIFAQEQELENEQVLKSSDFVLAASYGYPNWGSFNMNLNFSEFNYAEISTRGIAPITIAATYFYNDRISFSLIGMYNFWGGAWKDNFTSLNYDFNVSRLRILFGMEYHFFELDIKNVDLYAGMALGGNSITVNYESNDLNWTPRDNDYFMQSNDNLNFPLTGRAYAGMRYFFNENWGGNMELSYGGATMSFGVNYKFVK
jgi:hypothetical protein